MASIIVAFPSDELEIGKALDRLRNSEGYGYVPSLSNRFEWYLLLKNAKPLVDPLLTKIKERYNAEIVGEWLEDDWIGSLAQDMGPVRAFPIYNLAWKLEGHLTGVFLKFSGAAAIMRLESDLSVEELQGIFKEYQDLVSSEWKVACMDTSGYVGQWQALIDLAQSRKQA